MAVRPRVFVDTSVLVAGLIELGEQSGPANRILDAVAGGGLARPATAWHCCLEFYSVATRLPAGLRLEPSLARQLVDQEILARFEVLDLPASGRAAFIAAAAADGVAGGRIYDAHIAETARLARVNIVVTDNRRHFVGLLKHGLRVLTAAEFVDAQGW